MTTLAWMAVILGPVIMLLALPCIFRPSAVREGLRSFPRSVFFARVLSAIAIVWVASIVLQAPLGRFEWLKPYLYVAAPVLYFLIIFFMDELLAPRALGGLLLLAANPVLKAARWHESDGRLVMTVLAYVWVVAGITLVLSPYYFRRGADWATRTDGRCRGLAWIRLVIGLAILGLGLFVY